jgi:aminopeptidase N
MVFFMLRDLIGTEAYDRGIRTFWEQHRFKTASWRDLQLAFERASGLKLQTFFDQWLRRNDAPQLSLTEATGTSGSGRYGVTVKIAQQGAPYALRVPVVTMSGEIHRVAVDQASTEAHFETGAKTEAVKLDPDLRVWRQLQAQELPPILRLWIVASAPRYIVASADAGVQNAAAKLARRLFETTAQRTTEAAPRGTSDPTLIVGLHADVDALLARMKLPARPAALATAATAYVWTVQEARSGYPPIAVISARDTASLEALMRPLPHYGAQSYLAFDDARVVSRGIWPVASPAVPVSWR